MIVICEECGKKFRIDKNRINGPTASFNCNSCQHLILVHKPENGQAPLNADAVVGDGDSASAVVGGLASLPSEMSTVDDSPAPAPPEPVVAKPPAQRRFGLVVRIVLVMLVVALMPLIGLGFINLYQTGQRLEGSLENLGTQITTGLALHVDEWLDKNIRALNAVAKMPAVQSMDQVRQQPVFRALQKEYNWAYLIFSTDAKGNNVARSDGNALRSYADRQYYQKIINGQKMAWQTLIGKTSKKPAIVVAVPIKRNGRTVGVLASAMLTDTLSKRIVNWKQGDTGFAFLVDEKSKVLAHPRRAYVLKEKNLKTHPLLTAFKNGKRGIIEFEGEEQQDTIGYAAKTKLGWTLAIQQDKAEAFRDLRWAQTVMSLILVVAVLLVVLCALATGRTIARPITKLTEAADRISVGDLDVEIASQRNDEIGDLADAIGRMQESIRLSIERLRRRHR